MVIRMAITMPSTPPTPVRVMASIRNWPMMSKRRAPMRFADADFAGAFGDADQHDVHDADAAHQQAQSGNGDGDQADQPGDLVELLNDLVRRGDGEIVRLVGLEAADAAHDAFYFVERVLAHAGFGFGR